MGTKRQTTMAKLARERKLQEKRELKREKKQAAAAAKAAGYLPGEEEMAGDMTEDAPTRPSRTKLRYRRSELMTGTILTSDRCVPGGDCDRSLGSRTLADRSRQRWRSALVSAAAFR